MSIACPYCGHRIHLKDANPGRYRPRCPACAKPFVLLVPEEGLLACRARGVVEDTLAIAGNHDPLPPNLPTIRADSSHRRARIGKPAAAPVPGASHVFGVARPNAEPRGAAQCFSMTTRVG